MTLRRSTRLYSWNTMPMRRRAMRRAPRGSATRSCPSKITCPAVGSTSRLMQRIRVDLPVPEGPMTAMSARYSNSSTMPRSTGWPGLYSLTSPRTESAALTLFLALCGCFGFLPGERVERRLVELLAAAFGDLPHQVPVLLVIDREEAVGAVERLLHLGREAVSVETLEQRVAQLRLEGVRVRKRRGRKRLAAVEDAEVLGFYLSAVDHALEHVGGHRAAVEVAGAHRLDLRRVRLHLVEHHARAGALRQVVGKRLEDVLVHRGILHRGVGEDQRGRVLELFRIFRRIGDEVVVLVAVKQVEIAAIRAALLRERLPGGEAERDCNASACQRSHVVLLRKNNISLEFA